MSWRTRIVPFVIAAALAVPATPAAAVPPATGNPFLGALGYVDPDWSAAVRAAAGEGGDLAPAMTAVAERPTAVWLDSIAAIGGTPGRRGLRAHLDAAAAQQRAAGRPVVVTLVLYDLPGRSCTRAPGGDLAADADGLAAYRTRFVDPIAAILADPAYRRLRVAAVIEPDALADAVQPVYECARAGAVYRDAVPYVLTRLHELPRVSAYLDVTQSGRLGWADTLSAAVTLIADVASRTPGGTDSVDGFAVNVADYDPVDEPFLDIGTTRNGVPVRQSRWVDWADHLEESTFVDAVHAALVAAGFPERIGALLDTSRNGWGGPARPTGPGTSYALDAFVDQSRVDRRPARESWCNQAGAGLGEPPRAAPRPHVHAYAWVRPPGISDGTRPVTSGATRPR